MCLANRVPDVYSGIGGGEFLVTFGLVSSSTGISISKISFNLGNLIHYSSKK